MYEHYTFTSFIDQHLNSYVEYKIFHHQQVDQSFSLYKNYVYPLPVKKFK